MRLSEAPSLPSLQGCWSASPGGHFWLRPTLVLSERPAWPQVCQSSLQCSCLWCVTPRNPGTGEAAPRPVRAGAAVRKLVTAQAPVYPHGLSVPRQTWFHLGPGILGTLAGHTLPILHGQSIVTHFGGLSKSPGGSLFTPRLVGGLPWARVSEPPRGLPCGDTGAEDRAQRAGLAPFRSLLWWAGRKGSQVAVARAHTGDGAGHRAQGGPLSLRALTVNLVSPTESATTTR